MIIVIAITIIRSFFDKIWKRAITVTILGCCILIENSIVYNKLIVIYIFPKHFLIVEFSV